MPRVAKENKKLVDSPFSWIALITSAIILAVLAIFVTFQSQLFDGKVLAIVNGEKITESQLNEQIYGIDFQGSASEPISVDSEVKKELLDTLVEWKIAEIEAEKLGIEVTEEEVDKRIEKNIDGRFDNYTVYQRELTRENIKNLVRLEKVKEQVVAWREADFFVTRFDQSYELGLNVEDNDIKNRIASEKEYAKNLADRLYENLSDGKIDFKEAQNEVLSDGKIGKVGWGDTSSYTFAGKIFKDQSITKGLFHSELTFWNKVFEMEKGDLSEPFVVKLTDQDNGEHEAMYAVVGVTDGNSSDYSSYKDWLSAKKEEYKVSYKVSY